MIYLFDDTSIKYLIIFFTFLLCKDTFRGRCIFGNDKIEPPYFQVTFYSVPAVSSFAHEFPKMENLNLKVIYTCTYTL